MCHRVGGEKLGILGPGEDRGKEESGPVGL